MSSLNAAIWRLNNRRRISESGKRYRLLHKDELTEKARERARIKKNGVLFQARQPVQTTGPQVEPVLPTPAAHADSSFAQMVDILFEVPAE